MRQIKSDTILLSVIVPVFNEETNVTIFYKTVTQELLRLSPEFLYEIVFTDNHSTDKTFELLSKIASKDLRVRVARFSKNFGYQKSIHAGYCLSRGDIAIQLDSDLEDPPALIHEFIRLWREGYDVVYGIRRSRKELWLTQQLRRFFYRLIDFLSEDHIPHDAGDFRLLDRKIIEQLKKISDASPYLRGAIAAIGFEQVGVPYDRKKRIGGKSKFPLSDMVSLAVDGILNHSIIPLRLATFTGFIVAMGLSFYLGFLLAIKFIFHQDWPAGFVTVYVLIQISICLNALFLGIIGEYLGRIYRQVKAKPLVVIDQTLNF